MTQEIIVESGWVKATAEGARKKTITIMAQDIRPGDVYTFRGERVTATETQTWHKDGNETLLEVVFRCGSYHFSVPFPPSQIIEIERGE